MEKDAILTPILSAGYELEFATKQRVVRMGDPKSFILTVAKGCS